MLRFLWVGRSGFGAGGGGGEAGVWWRWSEEVAEHSAYCIVVGCMWVWVCVLSVEKSSPCLRELHMYVACDWDPFDIIFTPKPGTHVSDGFFVCVCCFRERGLEDGWEWVMEWGVSSFCWWAASVDASSYRRNGRLGLLVCLSVLW